MKLLETQSDEELICHFQQGNEKAFHVLYNRYQKKIFGTIYYYVKDVSLAEDISQEAYIKIINFIRLNRYSEKGKFLPWALRIVHNYCLDHLRKKNYTTYIPDFTGTSFAQASLPSPEARIIEKQFADHLHSIVQDLSVDQKKVAYFRYFEDMTFKEIAKITNTSVNTSLGRMRYALYHLRNKAKHHFVFN